MNKIPKIPRRIVTGNRQGKSVIFQDALITNVSEDYPGLVISDVWATDSMPVNLSREVVVNNTAIPHTPENGSYFRYVQIPPDQDLGIVAQVGQPHPLMHKTDTLDYVIILSGEIYLILEDGETLLKPGDIVIQQATNHAWSNRSDSPCIQLAILLHAQV